MIRKMGIPLLIATLGAACVVGKIGAENMAMETERRTETETETDSGEVNDMGSSANRYEDNLIWMQEQYGLDAEELEGLDLERFIQDYQLRTRDYSGEEIREILADERDTYLDDGTTQLYSPLEEEGDRLLQPEDTVIRICFYENAGTSFSKAVYDLKEGCFYKDDAVSHDLTEEQVGQLESLSTDYGILDWQGYYEGEEKPSTGSYYWKLVFETEDGSLCAYSGYTGDMTNLPEHYSEVRKILDEILKEKH